MGKILTIFKVVFSVIGFALTIFLLVFNIMMALGRIATGEK